MRTPPLDRDPIPQPALYSHMAPPWPAKWVGPSEFDPDGTHLFAYRLRVKHRGKVRVHVSADQRYILFLDGKRIGRGPERGDLRHWMYESYDLDLTGDHTLVAVSWWFSPTCSTPPAEAQQTVRPGFLMMAEGEAGDQIGTGKAAWEVKQVTGVRFEIARATHTYCAIDPRIVVDGPAYPWGVERGEGADWQPVKVIHNASLASLVWESHPYWILRPAVLPEMRESAHTGATVRHVEQAADEQTQLQAVEAKNNLAAEASAWSGVFGGRSVMIAANTSRRVIVDLNDYVCAFAGISTTGGRGATVRIRWAESLFRYDPKTQKSIMDVKEKGNRGEIEGRHFAGYGDTFTTDGGANRRFDPLWWAAGRYIEIFVRTGADPLVINAIDITRTGYPYEFTSTFNASDERLASVIPMGLRTLQMCSHETSMDCPYYEQLNYTGDTRLQSLVAMTFAPDDRLVRKGIQLFDWSRTGDSWSSSRWPTRVVQTIPPFALWWVAMVYDYAAYRGDLEFVRMHMPGVRSILERWRGQIDDEGLLTTPEGWNFMDWVGSWRSGMPNAHAGSRCGVIQWQFVYVLKLASELETMLNEPLLAQRHHQTAAMLAATAERAYFDAKRGLLADDPEHTRFSEHAQALAIISGHLSASLRDRVAKGLTEPASDLAKTSIYFSHYTFEALREVNRVDLLIDRMKLWFEHESMGLFTTIESPEPSRSDCHAWGAHPLFHYFGTILGIRPAAAGFEKVVITPRLGPLASAAGEMTHPKGTIRARFAQVDGQIAGEIDLPAGVSGECRVGDRVILLQSGRTRVA